MFYSLDKLCEHRIRRIADEQGAVAVVAGETIAWGNELKPILPEAVDAVPASRYAFVEPVILSVANVVSFRHFHDPDEGCFRVHDVQLHLLC